MSERIGVLINVLDFSHPHVKSIWSEGLWGFPDNVVNKKRWTLIKPGSKVLLYGSYDGRKGIYIKGLIKNTLRLTDPVKYWIENPTGYPLGIYLDLEVKNPSQLSNIKPVYREELAYNFGIRIFKAKTDRWSLIIFGDLPGATYEYKVFEKLYQEFDIRNRKVKIEVSDHESLKEILIELGRLQNKYTVKEIEIEEAGRIDVGWKKVERGYPYIVFEIQLKGNLHEALSKLKHAFDMWNSIPVLITTKEQKEQAWKIVSGSFHEIKHIIKIITTEEIKELYQAKQNYKEIERKLGII